MAQRKFPRLSLNFEDDIYLLFDGEQKVDLGKYCKSIRIEKDGGHAAEITMKLTGYPQIDGYLISKKDTAITKCDCGEILGYGLRGCIVRCNFCGKKHEL